MTGEFPSFDSEDSDASTRVLSALHFAHLPFYATYTAYAT
jgi:hypothetical protein